MSCSAACSPCRLEKEDNMDFSTGLNVAGKLVPCGNKKVSWRETSELDRIFLFTLPDTIKVRVGGKDIMWGTANDPLLGPVAYALKRKFQLPQNHFFYTRDEKVQIKQVFPDKDIDDDEVIAEYTSFDYRDFMRRLDKSRAEPTWIIIKKEGVVE